MHPLISKYKTAYLQQQGSSTQKVKSILMHHAHTWEWAGSPSMVADLIDDSHITADDIVDFLIRSYDDEGGNDEFHYAVRALQICLRKAALDHTPHSIEDLHFAEDEAEPEDGLDHPFHLFLDNNHAHFHKSN